MATMYITEGSFQTPASKKRNSSESPSLPPASQLTTPPSNNKNRTPLIATNIDPKFNTASRIMSELRQYPPSLRVYQIRQSHKGWIFIGDTPKDFAILQGETKMKQVLESKLRCHYQSHITSESKYLVFKGYLTTFQLMNLKNCLISTKSPMPRLNV